MNTKRLTRDEWAMGLASITAQRSTCLRRAVGCVLLNTKGHVLATGYNGVPAGFDHCNNGVETGLASVKIEENDEPGSHLLDHYFDRALKQNPGLVESIGGHVAPHRIWPSSIRGEVSVGVIHYKHACSGATAASGKNLDGCHAIHAEQNALLQCKNVFDIDSCYVTTLPCVTCIKLLLNTSCQKIYYRESYPDVTQVQRLWQGMGKRELFQI